MKKLKLLGLGLGLVALASSGCILVSAQVLAHFGLKNPFTINSTSTNHTQGEPVDLNLISAYADNKEKLKGILDLAIVGKFTNVNGPAGGVEVWITPTLDFPASTELPGPPPGSAVLLWGPGTIGASPASRVIGWDESAALFNAAGKALLLEQIRGDGTFTIYTTGSVGTYNILVEDGQIVLVLDAAK